MDKNKILHAAIVIIFLALSFVINKIPDGTFIAGGDFYQMVEINENLDRNLFTWFNQAGQGQYNPLIVAYPFYLFQYILYNIGFSYSNIANTMMFLFFIGSFYSFFFAIKIINAAVPGYIRLLCSAIYAVNIFTFTIFTYPWWATHHYIIYIFIPLLFAFFEKMVFRCSTKDIAYFIILFLISTMGFNNIAFLAALVFLQLLLLISFSAAGNIPLNPQAAKRIFFVFFLEFVLSLYFLLPYFASQLEYVSKISGGNSMGNLVNWLSYTSNNVYSIFSFQMLKDKYPSENLYFSNNISTAISLGYMIFLVLAILCQKERQQKYWLHYSIFLVALLLLLMRATPPFDGFNIFIYTLPGFNLFRSPDKLFVFYPFFYLVLLSLLLYHSSFSKKIIITVLVITLAIPVPFYIGGVQEYLSHEDQNGYRFTVKIPREYYSVKETINKDERQLSVISLPYGVVNSLNWANYPKWHFVGNDVLHLLYNKFYISANSYDHPALETNLSFNEYNKAGVVDGDKFLKLLQKFSGKYILLHKDINKYNLDNSKIIYASINELETKNIIKKLEENDYFTLYELNQDYLVPLIWSDKNYLYFQKNNPVEYKLDINTKEKTKIEFHQAYNTQWKLYLKPNPGNSWCRPVEYYKDTRTTECERTQKAFDAGYLAYLLDKPVFEDTHTMVQGYANSWTIDPGYIKANYPEEFYRESRDGSIEIEMVLYFRPQSYFYAGLIISGFAFLVSLIYIARDMRGRVEKNEI